MEYLKDLCHYYILYMDVQMLYELLIWHYVEQINRIDDLLNNTTVAFLLL